MAKSTLRFKKLRSPFDTKKAKEYADKMNKKLRQFRAGGIIIPKSDCCRAPITHTKGGVIMPICSKCKKIVHEKRYKRI